MVGRDQTTILDSVRPYCFSNYLLSSPDFYLAFADRDPVDAAIEWYEGPPPEPQGTPRIPVIMPANDKRAGGDWEASKIYPTKKSLGSMY
jgi:hypothetical protein